MLSHTKVNEDRNIVSPAPFNLLFLIEKLWDHLDLKENREILKTLLLVNSDLSNKIASLVNQGLRPKLTDFYQSAIPLQESKRFSKWLNAQKDFNTYNYPEYRKGNEDYYAPDLSLPMNLDTLVAAEKVTEERLKALSLEECDKLSHFIICDFITEDFLTIDEALNLTEEQIKILDNQTIFNLVEGNYITIEQAKLLSSDDFIRLTSSVIFEYIRLGLLTAEEAKALSSEDFEKINSESISNLIFFEVLTLEEVMQLNKEQSLRLHNRYIGDLVMNRLLTLEDAKQLNDNEFRNLNGKCIRQLITHKLLQIPEARRLSEAEFNKLENPDIFTLILSGLLTIQQAFQFKDPKINCLISQYKAIEKEEDGSNESLDMDELIKSMIQDKAITIEEAQDFLGTKKLIDNKSLFSEWINTLIKDKILTEEQAQNLTRDEVKNLDNQSIYSLIKKGKLSLASAKQLDEREFTILSIGAITYLILDGQLTLEKAKSLNLTPAQVTIISDPKIHAYITSNKLSIEEAWSLKQEDFLRLCTNRRLFMNIVCNDQPALGALQEFKVKIENSLATVFSNEKLKKRLLDNKNEPESKIGRNK